MFNSMMISPNSQPEAEKADSEGAEGQRDAEESRNQSNVHTPEGTTVSLARVYRTPGEQCEPESVLERAWIPVQEAMEYAKRRHSYNCDDQELHALPALFPGFPAIPFNYSRPRYELLGSDNISIALNWVQTSGNWGDESVSYHKYNVILMPKAVYTEGLIVLRVASEYYRRKLVEYQGKNKDIIMESQTKLKEMENLVMKLAEACFELTEIGRELIDRMRRYEEMRIEIQQIQAKVRDSHLASEKAIPANMETARGKLFFETADLFGERRAPPKSHTEPTFLHIADVKLAPVLRDLINIKQEFKKEYLELHDALIGEIKSDVIISKRETALVPGGDKSTALAVRQLIRRSRGKLLVLMAMVALTAGGTVLLEKCATGAFGAEPQKDNRTMAHQH